MARFTKVPDQGAATEVASWTTELLQRLDALGFRTDIAGLLALAGALLAAAYLLVRLTVDWWVAFHAKDTLGTVADIDIDPDIGVRGVIVYKDHRGKTHSFLARMREARKLYELERPVRVSFYPAHPGEGWLSLPRVTLLAIRIAQGLVMLACLAFAYYA